jgi:serine/threonine-protein phosphatase PGAM5
MRTIFWIKRLSPVSIVGVAAGVRNWNPDWDYRPTSDTKTRRNIFLVRHGQYVHDPNEREDVESSPEEDFIHNDPLRCLTPLGRDQAHITGKRLAEVLEKEGLLGKDGCAVRVYCSDMSRAKETGEIIHKHLQERVKGAPISLTVDPILREGAPCQPEGYKGPWKPSPAEFFEEGCRIETAFRKYFKRIDLINDKPVRPSLETDKAYQTVDVIVCHGNVIRYCLLRALQLPPTAWLQFAVANASITRLSVNNIGWVTCWSVGDTGAIPPSKVTFG